MQGLSLPLCMVLASGLASFFHMQPPVLPAPLVEEAVFAPLYVLASSVKKKVPVRARVYFWKVPVCAGVYFWKVPVHARVYF